MPPQKHSPSDKHLSLPTFLSPANVDSDEEQTAKQQEQLDFDSPKNVEGLSDSDGVEDEEKTENGLENDEFVSVKLADVRKEVQCPICLGIIRKTRTVMECLHRFCRECIDKSIRLGNNECPACRTHCPSRRSLRDDPNYDALIAALYPNIDKYEEEELAFHEDEKCRNKKIQANIAETVQKQTEASGKKKALAKATETNSNRRTKVGSSASNTSLPDSEEEDEVVKRKISFSPDEPSSSKSRTKRCKSLPTTQSSCAKVIIHAESSGEKKGNMETVTDNIKTSPLTLGSKNTPVWGSDGVQSQMRHGSSNVGVTVRLDNGGRIPKLMEHFQSLEENNDEIPANIAETAPEQTKASVKKKAPAKGTATNSNRRRTRGGSSASNRSFPDSEEEDRDAKSKDSSSPDDLSSSKSRTKRRKSLPTPQSLRAKVIIRAESSREKKGKMEAVTDNVKTSPLKGGSKKMPVWGSDGVQSQMMHGSSNVGVAVRLNNGGGIPKLVEHFKSLKENNDEFDVHLTLLPKDECNTGPLERPYICCQPTVSIGQLCKFIADQYSANPEDVKIFGKKPQNATGTSNDKQLLESHESLAGLRDLYCNNKGDLVFEYLLNVHS